MKEEKKVEKKALAELFENTKVEKVEVKGVLEKSFISYAMAVNMSRAIPDVRDGLKPVHRRILYDMGVINGLYYTHKYVKCANIVGDVLGKFHPHGDSSVYDALVRLAQDFSIRCPLVDGHGNFGSIDGYGAAAYRYTEARMSRIASLMLEDIEKDTVDMHPTYDAERMEPKVLPAKFPNLLVNGSDGIAVGMATNIPPHNLREVCSAVQAMIKNPDITDDEIIECVPAPDYPTGGIIMGRSGIINAYKTGRGNVTIRAKAEIEEHNGKFRIVVTEIPYQVCKSKLIMQMADLVKNKRIEGIADIKDESDREGIRIVIDIKKDANPQVVLNMLYKQSQLQTGDGIILLALVNREPKICTLKEIIYYYLGHQKDVVVRRTKFDLKKAEERIHIVQGLVIAVSNIDEVVRIIKTASDRNDANEKLKARFDLDDIQSGAILDMRLSKLTGLEVDKLKQELTELENTIKDLNDILNTPQRVLDIIDAQMEDVKTKFGEDRLTEISESYGNLNIADLIKQEDVVISLTNGGYIKRMSLDEYRAQRRGGVGVSAHKMKEEDFVKQLFVTNTHKDLLFFTNKGKVYDLKAYEIPEAQRTAKGRNIINLLQVDQDEKVTALLTMPDDTVGSLLLATKFGSIKKTKLIEFANIRKTGKIAISLDDGDELISAKVTTGNDEILVASSSGRVSRYSENDVRNMGRTAGGVKSIKLEEGETAIAMEVVAKDSQIITISENGYGKRNDVADYRLTGRGTKGVNAGKFNEKTGKLVSLIQANMDQDLMMIADNGIVVRTPVKDISCISRATQGVKLMSLRNNAKIVAVTVSDHEDEQEQSSDEIISEAIKNQIENNDNEQE